MKSNFITIEELKVIIGDEKKLFVFGVSEFGKAILDILRIHRLNPDFVVDNDKSRQGSTIKEIPIIAPSEILKYPQRAIIIANSYFAEIYEQLESMGISEVYEITDLDSSATLDLIEKDYLIKNEFEGEPSERILFYVADGFGDNIIKYPILERLSKSREAENYYFLTDRQANYDIYKSLFHNVFLYDRVKMGEDDIYRERIQREVNSKHFKKKICSCSSAFYCTHFDPFGTQNTNIPEMYSFYQCLDWENGRTKNNAATDLQRMAKQFFGWDDFDLSKKGAFSNVLKNTNVPCAIEGKYITLGMGGISWEHVYKAEDISKVAIWFLKNGYTVVLLGYGEKDEKYNLDVCKLCDNHKNLINLTSSCTAFQSLKIIEGSDLFIGLDSALAHGVYALDKKGIVLMSGNNFSRRFMHEGDSNLIYLTKELDCLGCYQCIYGKWNGQMDKRGLCFSSISPEEIISTAQKLLKE